MCLPENAQTTKVLINGVTADVRTRCNFSDLWT